MVRRHANCNFPTTVSNHSSLGRIAGAITAAATPFLVQRQCDLSHVIGESEGLAGYEAPADKSKDKKALLKELAAAKKKEKATVPPPSKDQSGDPAGDEQDDDDPEMRVELPEIQIDDESEKLTEVWNLEEAFDLKQEFDSQEFIDQIAYVDDQFVNFEKKYLKSPEALVQNFTEALKQFDELAEVPKKFHTFLIMNVYEINSRGHKVSPEAKRQCEKFKDQIKKHRRTLNEFFTVLRNVNGNQFKALCDLPAAKKCLPFLRAIRADHAIPATQQSTALNFAITHWNAFQEKFAESTAELDGKKYSLGSADIQQLPPEKQLEFVQRIGKAATRDEVLTEFIGYLRWSGYIYDWLSGSTAAPSDHYAYKNQWIGISSNASTALLKSLDGVGNKLWYEYLKLLRNAWQNYGLLPADQKLQMGHLLNEPWWATGGPKATEYTFEEFRNKLHADFEELSPMFAKSVYKLDHSMKRILWAVPRSQRRMNFYGEWGGRQNGGYMIAPFWRSDPQNSIALRGAMPECLKLALHMNSTQSNLFPTCREFFAMAIQRFLSQEFDSKYIWNDGSAGAKFQAAMKRLAVLKVMRTARAYDEFESGMHTLLDKIGPASTVSPKANTVMPNLPDVLNVWKECLKRFGGNGEQLDTTGLERGFGNILKNMQWGHPDSSTEMSWGPFVMDRTNYHCLVAYMAEAAVIDALKESDGSWKAPEKRDVVFQRILTATPNMAFDDYITALGGKPGDVKYWERVLESSFKKLLSDSTQLLKSVKPNVPSELLTVLTKGEAEKGAPGKDKKGGRSGTAKRTVPKSRKG